MRQWKMIDLRGYFPYHCHLGSAGWEGDLVLDLLFCRFFVREGVLDDQVFCAGSGAGGEEGHDLDGVVVRGEAGVQGGMGPGGQALRLGEILVNGLFYEALSFISVTVNVILAPTPQLLSTTSGLGPYWKATLLCTLLSPVGSFKQGRFLPTCVIY